MAPSLAGPGRLRVLLLTSAGMRLARAWVGGWGGRGGQGPALAAFEGMYRGTVAAAKAVASRRGNGAYLMSCLVHGITGRDELWSGPLRVSGVSLQDAVAEWWAADPSGPEPGGAAGDRRWEWLDCAWPCNGSCPPWPPCTHPFWATLPVCTGRPL